MITIALEATFILMMLLLVVLLVLTLVFSRTRRRPPFRYRVGEVHLNPMFSRDWRDE